LVGDWVAIVFFIAVGVGLASLLLHNSSASRVSYFALLLPLFFVLVTLMRFYADVQVGRMSLHERGLEIAGRRTNAFVEWKSVHRIAEKHGLQPGLLLRLKTGERVFIPVGITNYNAVRAYIVQNVSMGKGDSA